MAAAPLPRWVDRRAPASTAARIWSAVAAVWPMRHADALAGQRGDIGRRLVVFRRQGDHADQAVAGLLPAGEFVRIGRADMVGADGRRAARRRGEMCGPSTWTAGIAAATSRQPSPRLGDGAQARG